MLSNIARLSRSRSTGESDMIALGQSRSRSPPGDPPLPTQQSRSRLPCQVGVVPATVTVTGRGHIFGDRDSDSEERPPVTVTVPCAIIMMIMMPRAHTESSAACAGRRPKGARPGSTMPRVSRTVAAPGHTQAAAPAPAGPSPCVPGHVVTSQLSAIQAGVQRS